MGVPPSYAYALGFVDSTGHGSGHARQYGYHVMSGYGYVRADSDHSRDLAYDVQSTDVGSFLVRSIAVPIIATPIPAAVWLFGSGLIGLVLVARRASHT